MLQVQGTHCPPPADLQLHSVGQRCQIFLFSREGRRPEQGLAFPNF